MIAGAGAAHATLLDPQWGWMNGRRSAKYSLNVYGSNRHMIRPKADWN